MEVKLLPLLLQLLLGPLALVLAEPRDLYLVKELKSWPEAQRYCRETFYDLATLESAADVARAGQLVGRLGLIQAWVGLYDDVNSWRWSLDNASVSQGGSIQSVTSLPFALDKHGGVELCSYLTNSEQGDGDCSWHQRFICFDEPTNSYVPVYSTITWKESQSYCRKHHTDLASMRNQQERDAILTATGASDYWWSIGLFRDGWKWSDQSNSPLVGWAPYQPSGGSESCGSAMVEGLNDVVCYAELPFICSVPRRRVLKIMLKTVNPNDPLVQQVILKQVEDRLREHGFQQQLSIGWRKQPGGDVFSRAKL